MPDQRILIIGNCGTGKSTLAASFERLTGIAVTQLDHLHWLPDEWGKKREKAEVLDMLQALAKKPQWIAEGVFGWMAGALLDRATALIWLDYPWDITLPMLQARGPKPGESAKAYAELIAWAKDYEQRDSSSSLRGHQQLFDRFEGHKVRLQNPTALKAYVATYTR